ncbi:MAG TPA: MarR family transcriptional regulator [Deinococcales bacterium]|nr:MarR family transcriptional regulator [Deinococcales bacterium]
MTIDTRQERSLVVAADLRAGLAALNRRLREAGRMGGLTPSQRAALGRLERDGPGTVAALARAEGVRPQSMSATVAALFEAGMLTGTPDPGDGRQTLLALTPEARALISAGRAAREDWLARALLERLTPREVETLAAAAGLLARLAEP